MKYTVRDPPRYGVETADMNDVSGLLAKGIRYPDAQAWTVPADPAPVEFCSRASRSTAFRGKPRRHRREAATHRRRKQRRLSAVDTLVLGRSARKRVQGGTKWRQRRVREKRLKHESSWQAYPIGGVGISAGGWRWEREIERRFAPSKGHDLMTPDFDCRLRSTECHGQTVGALYIVANSPFSSPRRGFHPPTVVSLAEEKKTSSSTSIEQIGCRRNSLYWRRS